MEFYIFYSMNIPEYTQTLGEEKKERKKVAQKWVFSTPIFRF